MDTATRLRLDSHRSQKGKKREPGSKLAEKKKQIILRKGKQAGDLASKAAKSAVAAWNQLGDKGKDAIHRLHLEKRPLAIAKIKEIRLDSPKATPSEAQEILNAELSNVEASKGAFSWAYTSAASMYVLSSMELRGLDPHSKEANKMLFTLLVILDSRAVRGIRHVATAVVLLLPFLKSVKLVGGAAKAGKAVQKAAAAQKVLNAAKLAALPAAKLLVEQATKNGRISSLLVEQTINILGKPPKSWKKDSSKPAPSKATKKQ